MKPFLVTVSVVCLTCATAAGQEIPRPETLHSKEPAAFREQDAVNQPIDFDHVDRALLDAAVFHETNRRRQENGLKALTFLPALREAARIQSRAMVRLGKVTHRLTTEGLETPSARIKSQGLDGRFYAENVAMVFGIRYESGAAVYPRDRNGRRVYSKEPGGPPIPPHTYQSFAVSLLDEWMGSPGHRKNILAEEAESLGVSCLHDREPKGMDTFYCTQEFYAPFPGR